MKMWSEQISMQEVVRWDLFEDLLRAYIMTELASKFPSTLSLSLFFKQLIVLHVTIIDTFRKD